LVISAVTTTDAVKNTDNIVWIIEVEAEQWRHEEVVQASYGDDRQNDRYAQAAHQRHERDENHIDKGRPRNAEANVKADGGDQCQAGDPQQELGRNGLQSGYPFVRNFHAKHPQARSRQTAAARTTGRPTRAFQA
jgi:hypothetical protein